MDRDKLIYMAIGILVIGVIMAPAVSAGWWWPNPAPVVSSVWPTEAIEDVETQYMVNASDNGGVTQCYFYWDGSYKGTMTLISGNKYDGTWAKDYTESETGEHTAYAKCRDNRWKMGYGPVTTITIIEEEDTTPPGPVTGLEETSKGTTWIYWEWTNPSDPDLDHIEVWLDNDFQLNTTNEYYYASGLDPETQYELEVRPVDESDNIGDWTTDTATTEAEEDTTPPGPVTGLGETYIWTDMIYWQWTNPTDPDLDHIEVWLDNDFQVNTTNEYYYASGLSLGTEYEIEVRPVDESGNIGEWTTDTATTISAPTVSSVWPTTVSANTTTAFFVHASDDVQVTGCRFQWNWEPYISMMLWEGIPQDGNWTANWTTPGPGNYIANASCYDNEGNLGYGPLTNITVV